MIFVQFLMTVLALCVVAYQLTILPVGTVKFWSKIGAFNSYIFQIFLYCFYGEEIKQQVINILILILPELGAIYEFTMFSPVIFVFLTHKFNCYGISVSMNIHFFIE